MSHQGCLYLRTCDVITRRDDHVVASCLEPEKTFLIHLVSISGQVPSVADVFLLTRIIQVGAPSRPPNGELSCCAVRNGIH